MATSEGIPSSIDIEFLELNDNPYYNSEKETCFDTAEEFFAAQIAWGYLALWLGSE